MEQLLSKKALYNVELPPSTIAGWKQRQDQLHTRYGQFFTNREEFDLFTMLPINEAQRQDILEVMKEEARFRLELSTCTGVTDSSAEHRAKCLMCVTKTRPLCAQPSY